MNKQQTKFYYKGYWAGRRFEKKKRTKDMTNGWRRWGRLIKREVGKI